MDTTGKYINNIAHMTEDDEALSWTTENDGETWAYMEIEKACL